MSNSYFERNLRDVSHSVTWALPTDVGSGNATSSSGIDIASQTFRPEEVEVSLVVPALSSTIAPAASTAGVTFIIEQSASSTFNGTTQIYQENIAGSGSGIAAKDFRARLPSNGLQYIRGRIYLGTTCTDASAVTATLSLRF